MTYWTVNVIKIVMSVTTEELHQVKEKFPEIFGKIWNAFCMFRYCLIWLFL